MDAKDLHINQLNAQLQSKESQLDQAYARLQELSTQLSAVTEQYSQRIDEKDHRIALLEQKIRKLLSTVRGSRQERINPDQLLLFSTNELKEIADEISSQQENDACASDASEEPNEPDKEELDKKKAKRRKLPSDLPKEIKRYELAKNCVSVLAVVSCVAKWESRSVRLSSSSPRFSK